MQLRAGDGLRAREWTRRGGSRTALLLFLAAVLGLSFPGRLLAVTGGTAGGTAATQTALTVSIDNSGPWTKATLTAHVAAVDTAETPPSGVVTFRSAASDLGSAVLDGNGNATLTTGNQAPGSYPVVAVYQGDAAHAASISQATQLDSQAATVAGFTATANPTSFNFAAGAFATSVVTLTPVNGFSGYVSLSCSGLPTTATCTFSPTNVLVSCTTTGTQETCTPVVSTVQIQTLAPSGAALRVPGERGGLAAYAFALPALFGLGGSIFGLQTRKRRAQNRVESRVMWRALLAFFLLAGMLSMTACSQRYNYLNHGAPANPGTPAGTYVVTIDAVSVNGSQITTPPTAPQLTLTITD